MQNNNTNTNAIEQNIIAVANSDGATTEEGGGGGNSNGGAFDGQVGVEDDQQPQPLLGYNNNGDDDEGMAADASSTAANVNVALIEGVATTTTTATTTTIENTATMTPNGTTTNTNTTNTATTAATGNDETEATTAAVTEGNNQDQGDSTSTANASATATGKAKKKKKVGSKKGGKRVDRPQSFWYNLCLLFDRGEYKSQIQFLRSPDSGDDVGETHRMHFSRAYKKYQNGTLGNCEETRARKRKYEPLEQRVIQYWTEQQQQQRQEQQQQQEEEDAAAAEVEAAQQQLLYDPYNPPPTGHPPQEYGLLAGNGNGNNPNAMNTDNTATTTTENNNTNDDGTLIAPSRKRPRNNTNTTTTKTKKGKSPLAWSILQAKAKEWAKEMGLDDGFQASAGWIDNVLKRHQRETEAQQNRASLDATLAQRRNQAQYSQKLSIMESDLRRSNQLALMESKGLKVGDRVTVLDISQQVGDVVITQLEEAPPDPAGNGNTHNNNYSDVTFVVVERKRHGSTQRFAISDTRKVVQHLPQEEDTATIQQLLLPQNQDAVLAHMAHFPFATKKPQASRVLRPIWEFPQDEAKVTTSMRLEYSDTSCPEKINIQTLKSFILPMFRRDQKERQKAMEDLQALSQRSKVQQEALEKLQYAQATHDMAKDLYALVKNMPARGRMVVYQVDYQALDASMRGRLIAHNPAPFSDEQDEKSYAPRTLNLQAMPADLRTALVSSFAHLVTTDQDMMLCIFCSLAHICHASDLIPNWLDYQMHTSAWCEYIQNVHAGITQDQAKSLPQILLQGGTYETWRQAIEEQTAMDVPAPSDGAWINLQTFVLRLSTEWRALRDICLTLPQFAWTQIDRNAMLTSHDKAPAAIPNVLMVRVMQACERDIWTLVERTFVNQGWKVRAKLMEGILVEGPSSVEPLTPVLASAQHACNMRGWNVALVEGHCFGSYPGRKNKDALPSLQEAREAMERLQGNHGDNNANLITAGNITIDQANGGTVNVNVNANSDTTSVDLDPATANGDIALFGQI